MNLAAIHFKSIGEKTNFNIEGSPFQFRRLFKLRFGSFFVEKNNMIYKNNIVRQCFISLVMTCLDRGTSLNFHFHVPLIKTLFQFSCQSFRNQVQLPEPGRNKLQNYPPFHQSPEILLASCCKRM